MESEGEVIVRFRVRVKVRARVSVSEVALVCADRFFPTDTIPQAHSSAEFGSG